MILVENARCLVCQDLCLNDLSILFNCLPLLFLGIRNLICWSIRTRIVPGWRLARRREMVSRPPENILSTATAEPNKLDQEKMNEN
jgi:hypothetical protein